MKIKLISLELKNFKGIKEQLINFDGFGTQISGDNGIGKSTIFDSFCWLLFGKDSHERKAFEIQTLDENNNIIHHLEHSVTGTLEIDGVQKTFKRTLKEKWQKKRGQAEQELTGTQTDYEINDIPVKQKEYLEKIGEILEENSFKLLTNPLYFPNMEWKKQREILLDIIGDLDEESVINYNSSLKPLLKMLEGTNIDDFNKKVAASIKKLKDKVKDIPARIDENNSMICNEDFTELEKQKNKLQNEINVIDEQITDLSKANEGKFKLQESLFELKGKLGTLRNDALRNANKPLEKVQEKINKVKSDIQDITYQINSNDKEVESKRSYIDMMKESIERTKERKAEKLAEYHKENNNTFNFDISLTNCPTCGREYDIEKIEEIKVDAENKFNAAKKKILENVISQGKSIAKDIERIELKVNDVSKNIKIIESNSTELSIQKLELEKELEQLEYEKQKIDCIEPVIEGEKELILQIETVEAEISNFKSNDNSSLIIQKKALQEQLSNTDKLLGKQQTNAELKARIEELGKEEKDLNIQIAQLEKQQFLGEEFIRTKVELLEDTINKKFKGEVNFKLFSEQINGGISETCIATINGVPFSDANSAAKINAGISILNTLCEHYGILAPVFIDNAETINNIRPTESQLILLKVSQDKKMKVEVM